MTEALNTTQAPQARDEGDAARGACLERFFRHRQATEALTEDLSPEDQVVQSMEDASPAKWHLAHTTWFFEEFILTKFAPAYRPFDPDFFFLFNSYYEGAGPRHARPRRGMLTRPSVDQVVAYRLLARDTVEEKVLELQQHKRELANAIINADNSLIGSLAREDLEFLLS